MVKCHLYQMICLFVMICDWMTVGERGAVDYALE